MRIVAGRFRGRRLASVGAGDAAAHLRPTPDRVRESLFSMLAHRDLLDGARVLELFAGTGAQGLEALSRGATHATFVDSGRKAQSLLRENIRLTGTQSETRVLTCDATRLPANDEAPFDLVFLDPPYGRELGGRALTSALQGGWITGDAVVVWEENEVQHPPEGLCLLETRKFGGTVLTLLERR